MAQSNLLVLYNSLAWQVQVSMLHVEKKKKEREGLVSEII